MWSGPREGREPPPSTEDGRRGGGPPEVGGVSTTRRTAVGWTDGTGVSKDLEGPVTADVGHRLPGRFSRGPRRTHLSWVEVGGGLRPVVSRRLPPSPSRRRPTRGVPVPGSRRGRRLSGPEGGTPSRWGTWAQSGSPVRVTRGPPSDPSGSPTDHPLRRPVLEPRALCLVRRVRGLGRQVVEKRVTGTPRESPVVEGSIGTHRWTTTRRGRGVLGREGPQLRPTYAGPAG